MRGHDYFMIIERNIRDYVVYYEETVETALKKIARTQGRILFCVTQHGELKGVLSNGDILRWLLKKGYGDLSSSVSEAANTNYVYVLEEEDGKAEKIRGLLHTVLYVPILDEHRRLKSIARRRQENEGFFIGEREVSELSPAFIVAEIGINHNGSEELARRMIDEAVGTGADCVKFQMRDLGNLYHKASSGGGSGGNLGEEYTLEILQKAQLPVDAMLRLFDYARSVGTIPLCTPWDIPSVDVLEEYGMSAYKTASADFTNHQLLQRIASNGKPLICSTGMTSEPEIAQAIDLLQRLGAQYALLHTNSTYPSPLKDINLNYLQRLQQMGGCLVGYSGHERGYVAPLAATALGAKIIEKHFTLDRSMEGNDHKVSLLPAEFAEMVRGIREVEEALGSGAERLVSQGEMMNRVTLSKSLIVNQDLSKGETVAEHMISVASPGRGIQPNRKGELVGKTLRRNMKKGDFFFESDLKENAIEPREYKFQRKWGVPVRWHDFQDILKVSNPDLLEFHLSYKDMDKQWESYFEAPYSIGYTVHSPDLFSGDHLLNLSAQDPDYRARSTAELQRVVDLTRNLNRFFPGEDKPLIIASVGGFTRDALVAPADRIPMYERLAESLEQIDSEGVEIIPQTLPPFPWYFGGQLYLNLFVDPEDTAWFCETYGYRLCLDICHSKLACNHFGWSLTDFIEKTGKHAAHLHLSDARGVDGEGIQIYKGDIDFVALANALNAHCPEASFIPEIWQGHENNGEGFWEALEKLEGLL